jgi:ATP/maltotriose-dependent transcriptional regulator MalT
MKFAKISRPVFVNPVQRPLLFRRLDGTKARLIWVSGTPGSGKSTLVSSYLATRKVRNVWYQCDEGDADLAAFFYYLRQAAPPRRMAPPLFTPEYRQDIGAFTRRFFRDLFGRFSTPFVLVFDNYQDLPPAAEVHDVLRQAIDELPPSGRLVVISRGDPPPSLAIGPTGQSSLSIRNCCGLHRPKPTDWCERVRLAIGPAMP